ncbi:MAG TPA: YlmC/YmxH family sporulation protein [Firmicutes bacterium]|nr:YlmC/YmxH family sporulation protein [Bacillota bacterium]
MRLSELMRLEIISSQDGVSLGTVGGSDLVIDSSTGKVVSLVIRERRGLSIIPKRPRELVIPWRAVKIIGPDVLIVDIPPSNTL